MFKRLVPIAFLLLTPACDDGQTDGIDNDAVGGKADQIGPSDDVACPAEVYVTHAANDVNNHVFSNCHDAVTGKFAAKACCQEKFDLIEDVSGCPAQVRFTHTADADDTRCANDVDGHDGEGQFVNSACCAALCDSDAGWDDNGACRSGAGTFEDSICCHRNFKLTQANCVGAEWIALEGGTRDHACRAPNGQFTFNACCVDQCAQEITDNELDNGIPAACGFDADVGTECVANATPNSAGQCHNPDNGQYTLAVCCQYTGETEDLDIEASDACWAGKEQQACVSG